MASVLIQITLFGISAATRIPFVCNPDSLAVQGHAIWHILSAVAAYFLFVYFVAEKDEATSSRQPYESKDSILVERRQRCTTTNRSVV